MSKKRARNPKSEIPPPNLFELRWWHAALPVIISLLCYLQTVGYEFVWDDNTQILHNDRIRSFSNLFAAFNEHFWEFFGVKGHYYRPLHTVSYMAAYAVGGLSPAVYHWLNIILNAFAVFAAFWLGYELFRNASIAFWGALLFAVHPMHTENVAWNAGITDLGCALFYFISLIAWRRSNGGRRYWLWVSALSFFMALLYKETAATLPLIALMMDFAFEQENARISVRNRITRLLPLALAFICYSGLRYHALGSLYLRGEGKAASLGAVDHILTVIYLAGLYIAKLVIPIGHVAYNNFRPFSEMTFGEWIPPVLLLALAAWATYRFLRNDNKVLFLVGWFLVTLGPVLHIGGHGPVVFCERYLYIPSFGFCLLLAALAERVKGNWERRAVPFAGFAVVAVLGILTINRNPVWQDDRTLVQVTLGISPDIVKDHQDRGVALLQKGDLDGALNQFNQALETEASIFIRSPENRYNSLIGAGTVHFQAGRLQQAWDAASEARTIDPKRADAYGILGAVRGAQGRTSEAEELLSRAVALDPQDTAVRVNLGNVLLVNGKAAGAERQFRLALETQPHLPDAQLGLALSLKQLGRKAEARILVEDLLKLDPANITLQAALAKLQ